MIKKQD